MDINKLNNPGKQIKDVEVTLEEALDIAGTGKYQVFHGILMLASLSAAMMEITGYGFVMPSAACDLQLSDNVRGIIVSIPNIGVILTATLWGLATDARGRKPILLFTSLLSGLICFVAAFMPNLISFAICKLIGSLFLAGPSALGYAYIGELTPRKHRDRVVLVLNGCLLFSSAFTVGISWGILPHDWQLNIQYLNMRPWRVLTAALATPLVIVGVWMTQAVESPKFLMTKGKEQEAIEVLRHIYAFNTGLLPASYPVTSIKAMTKEVDDDKAVDNRLEQIGKNRILCLLRPPYVGKLVLICFLTFGLMNVLVGFFIFVPATINVVMTTPSNEAEETICEVIKQSTSLTESCSDNVSSSMFIIMMAAALIYGGLITGVSFTPLSDRLKLCLTFTGIGAVFVVSVLLKNTLVAVIFLSSIQTAALGLGPLNVFTNNMFPTHLRGTAVGAAALFSRLGCIAGASASGYLLATACSSTFYMFAGLFALCALLCFLLPKKL